MTLSNEPQHINDEQLVNKWLEAKKNNMNQSWVAEELGVSRQAISQRKKVLLKAGVKLPKLNNTYRVEVPDVTKLNNIIQGQS